MRNIALWLSYDGTDFFGFQRQKDLPTIQGEVEGKLSTLLGEKIRIIPASRTDAGVHARQQIVNFHTNSSIPVHRLPCALNNLLPSSIRVISAKEVPLQFHARFHAKSRRYKYFLLRKIPPFPFLLRFALYYPFKIDLEPMLVVKEKLIGVKDFSAFTPQKGKTIRNLLALDIIAKDNIIIFTLEANAFLKGMVRNIIGFLLAVGRGKLSPVAVEEALQNKRNFTNLLVPPQGLFLWKVKFSNR